jgi:hypothetical protein
MRQPHHKFPLFRAVIIAGIGLAQISSACPGEGRITHFDHKANQTVAHLDSGMSIETGKKSIYTRILKYAFDAENQVCVTNTWNTVETGKPVYPKQMVARIDLSSRHPARPQAGCVKAGYIERVYVNDNYDWFHLEDGFSIRVIHRSKLTDTLYRAAFTKRQVCITRMNLDGSGPDWGIPRALHAIE